MTSQATTDATGAALLAAVRQLTQVVATLDATMKEDYPKRSEIRRSRRTFIWAVLVGIVCSYFANVSTVNYCFLQGTPEVGSHSFCQIFPGWDDSFNNNRQAMQTFIQMQQDIARDQKEIANLKRQLAKK